MQNFENQFTSLFKECSDRLGEQPEEDLLFLQQLVELIRPEGEEDLSRPTQQFILFLESHPEEREMLAQCLRNLFASKSFVSLLTDVAIPQASDFFFEVKEKIVAKLIPSQPPKNHWLTILIISFIKLPIAIG
jgi:site-specific recombinase